MPVRIVNALEIVQIHEHNCENPLVPFRLSNSMFQSILGKHAVRQTGQIVMQGGIARTFLLFHRRGQLMIDHGAISYFDLQRLIHCR